MPRPAKRWPFVISLTIQMDQLPKIRCGRTEWEVQESNERGELDWFSDAPYLTKREAFTLGRKHPLSPGHSLCVNNVATGKVAYRRSGPPAEGASDVWCAFCEEYCRSSDFCPFCGDGQAAVDYEKREGEGSKNVDRQTNQDQRGERTEEWTSRQ